MIYLTGIESIDFQVKLHVCIPLPEQRFLRDRDAAVLACRASGASFKIQSEVVDFTFYPTSYTFL